MRNPENLIVSVTTFVEVTLAQQELLDLIKPVEAETFADSLRAIHKNGTYYVDKDLINPSASFHTHLLLEVLQKIQKEFEFNNAMKIA